MTIQKYHHIMPPVEALQYNGKNIDEFKNWLPNKTFEEIEGLDGTKRLAYEKEAWFEGEVIVEGNWLVVDCVGKTSVIMPNVFDLVYRKV